MGAGFVKVAMTRDLARMRDGNTSPGVFVPRGRHGSSPAMLVHYALLDSHQDALTPPSEVEYAVT